MGLLYLSAGIPKLVAAVTDGWASAESLRMIAWSQWFYRGLYQPGFTPARWLDAVPDPLLSIAGLGVIAFEVTFVGLVLRRDLRPFLAVAGVLFHVANGVLLGIWFTFLVPAYAALIDWSALGRRFDRRETRRRARTEEAAGRRTEPVVALGAALIAGQAIVSAVCLAAPTWPVPRWPFDAYPSFTEPRPRQVTVWEAWATLRDGQQVKLGPRTWARAFGSPARCRRVADALLDRHDPERQRTRMRQVLALLWREEAPDVRDATTSVAAHRAHYAIGPAPRRFADGLLASFTVDEIAAVDTTRREPSEQP
jgi:hypothetical protein